MEVVGLAFGAASLAGLYSACIEAVDRIGSYRHFERDKKQLLARLDANKDIFEKWAERVGMSVEALLVPHDARLDDVKTAKAVSQVLTCIRDLFGDSGQANYRSEQNQNRKTLSAPKRLYEPSVKHEPQAPSRRRDKLAWTFHGKSKLESQVLNFAWLVETLDRLVPPHGSSEGGDLNQVLAEFSFLLIDHNVLQRQKDQDRKDVLAWLDPNQPNGRYEACRRERIPSTCSWIFDKKVYQEWRSHQFPRDAAKFLWLHGPTGFGKSFLCAAIVESLEREEDLRINHYFCASTSVNQDNPSAILRAWISQLILQDDGLVDLACEEIRRLPSPATSHSLWKLFRQLIEDTSNCMFVVDGLDECEASSSIHHEQIDEHRLNFLKQLQRNVESTDCCVLIVSRDEPDIRSQLSSSGPHVSKCAFYEYEILKTDVGPDNLAHSQSLVKEKLHNKSDADQNEIAEQMAGKCEGMFLWVELQGRQLSGGKSTRKLQQIVKAMPKELGSLYRKSWETILNRPSDERSRALSILRWATFAARPLTVSEITEALIIPDHEDDEDLLLDEFPDRYDREYLYDMIIDLCASLVEIRPTSPEEELESWTIHLRHFSIKEFLLTTDACETLSDLVSIPAVDQVMQNNHLAAICLRYLQCEWDIEAGKSLLLKKAFYEYAAQNWYLHISETGSRYSTLINSVNKFLEPKNTFWEAWRLHFETVWHKQQFLETQSANYNANPLYYASWFGLKDSVDHLRWKYTEMLNMSGGRYGTPLQAACYAGHSTVVKYLLEIGADPNTSTGHFGSALGAAAANGNLEICVHLLNNNACVSLTDQGNRTPIYFASRNGNQELVELLLDRGADVSTAGEKGGISLKSACYNGHLEVVRLLLDRGADLSTADDEEWTSLHLACRGGYLELVELLLDRGADLSNAERGGWTPFHVACIGGFLEVVRLLLNRGADLSNADNNRWTPLHFACVGGDLEVVRLLLDRGANLSNADNDGWTPLHFVCDAGYLEAVRLLVDRSAELSAADNCGWTSLYLACRGGYLEVVRLLLDRGADLSVTTTNNRWTPLYSVCNRGHLEVVKLLLDRGADLSTTDDEGWTPLYAACYNGHLEVVRLLLDRGAVLSTTDEGWTPLHTACYNGYLEVVRLLLDRGADLSTTDDEGWTPLYTACNRGHLEVVRLLLDQGADHSTAKGKRWTPLYSACHNGYLEVVRLLLDRGADLSTIDDEGWTPLYTACNRGHLEIVRLLLDQGADHSTANENGWTPLYSACHNGYLEVVKQLLDRGAEISAADDDGWTPLCSACYSGHLEVVRLLLDRGADFSIPTKESRRTPLHSACSGRHLEVVKLLLERNADLSMVDDNGRTPLYVACSAGTTDIIKILLENTKFPEAISKMGDTCLHLACRQDSPDNIDLLMSHGYDPFVVDDYGRSPVDWASHYQPCMDAISRRISQWEITPKATTEYTLKRTLNRLITNAISETSECSRHSFYCLGHSLMFYGDEQNAYRAFEQNITFEDSKIKHQACCNRCSPDENILGVDRFVCKSCADVDLCQQCFELFREDEKPWRCKSHEFLRIPRPGFVPDSEDETRAWLHELQIQYSEQ